MGEPGGRNGSSFTAEYIGGKKRHPLKGHISVSGGEEIKTEIPIVAASEVGRAQTGNSIPGVEGPVREV